jgi:hypothetical protein
MGFDGDPVSNLEFVDGLAEPNDGSGILVARNE